jgi:DNA-binding MarR family transcriptional regulator
MDRNKASRKLMESFLRMVNKYKAMEKFPLSFGTEYKFYHSERHMLDIVGDNRSMNMTTFAQMNGVTKGAVSQIVSKLENKGAIRRYKEEGNEKEVFIELTDKGKEIYEHHQRVNDETVKHLEQGLKNYPDDKVEFLLTTFMWFEEYLDEGRQQMERHVRE